MSQTLSTVELICLNKEKSTCEKTTIEPQQNVVAWFDKLLKHPFTGNVKKLYERTALIEIDETSPLPYIDAKGHNNSDHETAIRFARQIVVPINNIMPIDKATFAFHPTQNILNHLQQEKQKAHQKIKKTQIAIQSLEKEQAQKHKNLTDKRNKQQECANTIKNPKTKPQFIERLLKTNTQLKSEISMLDNQLQTIKASIMSKQVSLGQYTKELREKNTQIEKFQKLLNTTTHTHRRM